MKKILLVAGFVFPAATLSAQYVAGQSVEYSYDAAGNRILREPWNPSQGPSNKTNSIDQSSSSDSQMIDHYSSQIQLFPNPTSGQLLIQLKDEAISEKAGLIHVFSAQGELVKKFLLEPGADHLEVDLANLPSGMYFLQLTRETESFRQSIVKN